LVLWFGLPIGKTY